MNQRNIHDVHVIAFIIGIRVYKGGRMQILRRIDGRLGENGYEMFNLYRPIIG